MSIEDDRLQIISDKICNQFIEFEKAKKFHDIHLEIEAKIGTQDIKEFRNRNFSEDAVSYMARAL